MRWLIIQSDGAHKGRDDWTANWFLRECYSLQDALLRCHQIVDIWGLRHPGYDPNKTPDWDRYDIIFVVENYEMDWLPDFSKVDKPIMQWIIDLHVQNWQVYEPVAEYARTVLHSTKSLMNGFEQHFETGDHLWFPNAIDDRYFRCPYWTDARRDDVVFIGGKGAQRERHIDHMVSEVGMKYDYGITGYDYIGALLQAKIGFNKNLAGDINYRTFEVLACGACLLTEFDPCLEELGFRHGINCLIYHNLDEAVELARNALKMGSWRHIAKNGMDLALHHTYYNRMITLAKRIRQYYETGILPN